MKNLLEILFDQLEVRYTHTYITNLYNEHPHKDNMYGLVDILHSYNINAVGIKIEDKDYEKLTFPCILHLNSNFVVSTGVKNGVVLYNLHGRNLNLPIEKFNSMWTGNAMVIDGESDAMEPDYDSHLRKEQISLLKKLLFVACLLFLFGVGVFQNLKNFNFISLLYGGLDLIGLIPCWLLLEKQVYSESKVGDRVCSLFHQKDCNNVLYSDKSRFGGISWSEIGFSFFLVHLLCLVFNPICMKELSIIGTLGLLYTVWSIYYQWRVVKQWCVLCLLVQCVIILMACLGLYTVFEDNYSFNLLKVFIFCSLWFLFAIVMNIFSENIKLRDTKTFNLQKYKALKANKIVFHALLTTQKYNETTQEDSYITFGNKNAKTRVTVLTNPHCNPCADTHVKIDKLLEKNWDKICVQYVFSSFNEELKESNRFLIAVWQQLGEKQALDIFSQWYREGKYHANEFMDRWKDLDIHSSSVEAEINRHEAWKVKTGYNSTPTILVNGYELPIGYNIEEISTIID